MIAEHQIKRDQQLTTIPKLKKEWRVSFDLKANSFGRGLRQVFHMTIGGKGSGRGSKYGDRVPAVWTHPSRGILVASAVNGRYSYAKWINALPAVGEWINIVIGQEIEDYKMMYFINIGGKKMFSIRNSKPEEFENVQVFTSSAWYSSLDGSIRNLLIKNKYSNHAGCKIFELTFFIILCFRTLEQCIFPPK